MEGKTSLQCSIITHLVKSNPYVGHLFVLNSYQEHGTTTSEPLWP